MFIIAEIEREDCIRFTPFTTVFIERCISESDGLDKLKTHLKGSANNVIRLVSVKTIQNNNLFFGKEIKTELMGHGNDFPSG